MYMHIYINFFKYKKRTKEKTKTNQNFTAQRKSLNLILLSISFPYVTMFLIHTKLGSSCIQFILFSLVIKYFLDGIYTYILQISNTYIWTSNIYIYIWPITLIDYVLLVFILSSDLEGLLLALNLTSEQFLKILLTCVFF